MITPASAISVEQNKNIGYHIPLINACYFVSLLQFYIALTFLSSKTTSSVIFLMILIMTLVLAGASYDESQFLLRN